MIPIAIFVASLPLTTLPLGVKSDDPQRYIQTDRGLLTIGTCDAAVFAENTPDAKGRLVRYPIMYMDVLKAKLRLGNGIPGLLERDKTGAKNVTLQGEVFRSYAAGRLAFKYELTGEVRVAFDLPRLSLLNARLHSCAHNGQIYYVSTGYGGVGGVPGSICVTELDTKIVSRLPTPGTDDANIDSSIARLKVNTQLYKYNGYRAPFDVVGPIDLKLATLINVGFDFSHIGYGQPYYYYLKDGILKKRWMYLLELSPDGGGSYEWRESQFKTDLTGPFWIVQVVPDYFIAVQRDGRVVHFMSKSGDQPQKVTQMFRQGKNVKIIHDGDEATVESDSYKFRLTATGIHLPVTAESKP